MKKTNGFIIAGCFFLLAASLAMLSRKPRRSDIYWESAPFEIYDYEYDKPNYQERALAFLARQFNCESDKFRL